GKARRDRGHLRLEDEALLVETCVTEQPHRDALVRRGGRKGGLRGRLFVGWGKVGGALERGRDGMEVGAGHTAAARNLSGRVSRAIQYVLRSGTSPESTARLCSMSTLTCPSPCFSSASATWLCKSSS